MTDYNLFADLLNKYSQLTPWVQALVGLGLCTVMLGVAYFLKETVAVIMQPLQKTSVPIEDKRVGQDKYYRGGEGQES